HMIKIKYCIVHVVEEPFSMNTSDIAASISSIKKNTNHIPNKNVKTKLNLQSKELHATVVPHGGHISTLPATAQKSQASLGTLEYCHYKLWKI
ncbi:hypothetical protein ACJX0J_032340, partial [Zea mays]